MQELLSGDEYNGKNPMRPKTQSSQDGVPHLNRRYQLPNTQRLDIVENAEDANVEIRQTLQKQNN